MFFIRTAKTDQTGKMTRPVCIVVGSQVILINSHKLAQHWILEIVFFLMPKKLKTLFGLTLEPCSIGKGYLIIENLQ